MSEKPKFLFGFPVVKFDGYTVGMLRWTTEPPTEPGWYWAIRDLKHGPVMVEVEARAWDDRLLAHEGRDNFALSVFEYYLGPLPVPELPTDL